MTIPSRCVIPREIVERENKEDAMDRKPLSALAVIVLELELMFDAILNADYRRNSFCFSDDSHNTIVTNAHRYASLRIPHELLSHRVGDHRRRSQRWVHRDSA